MSYVTTAQMEILEKLLKNHTDLDEFVDLAENQVNDIAEARGVSVGDIKTDPVHYKITRYAQCYAIGMALVSYGKVNNNSKRGYSEKYHDYYKEKIDTLEDQLTYQIFVGGVNSPLDRARVSNCWRG